MTKLEKQVLLTLIKKSRNPSVTTTIFEKGRRIEMHTSQEAGRLLDSPEFKKGWELCHRHFAEYLEYITSGELTTKDLKTFVSR